MLILEVRKKLQHEQKATIMTLPTLYKIRKLSKTFKYFLDTANYYYNNFSFNFQR